MPVAALFTAAPSQHVLRVIGITAVAWGVRLPSAQAVARRAPHGYRPLRALHRLHTQLAAHPQLAHSW